MMGFASKAATAPYWLETLLREKFFLPCMVHETSKKNEKNIFCLDCCITICPQCLIPHRSHRLLQVKHLLRCEGGLAKYLYECKYLPLPENPKGESLSVDIDERQLSPDSVLDSPAPSPSASGSSASGGGGGCRPVSEFARKRRSGLSGASTRPAVAFRPSCSETVNRRKRVPSRSPLF
ncbi:hypothetical protein QJS04_geneDACA020498 [Acorus gramineus]|uniref:B box-type domain-containing protein n=1 Tax=Acorus gramineus TaxID=55184 RepID=A0AAV9AD88_ACOGR|nr:hypothetical protein QJS04_geneDACA020498 [Acorus gramineus]